METTILRVLLAVAFALIVCRSASAQEVHTTNIVMETKERVLRIESIIPATPKEVWKAFATQEGLKKWIAPVVALDLRIGGTLFTHYDKNASTKYCDCEDCWQIRRADARVLAARRGVPAGVRSRAAASGVRLFPRARERMLTDRLTA